MREPTADCWRLGNLATSLFILVNAYVNNTQATYTSFKDGCTSIVSEYVVFTCSFNVSVEVGNRLPSHLKYTGDDPLVFVSVKQQWNLILRPSGVLTK